MSKYTKEYVENFGPRYWTIDNPEPIHKAPLDATGEPMEPLVDEEAGGIIGFIADTYASEIVNKLNSLEG